MGTKKLILVPMGTKVPKWGPTWEQCTSLIVFLLLSSLLILFCEVKKMQEQVKIAKSIVQDKSIHLFNCSLCLPGYLDTCLSLSFNPAPTKNQKEKEKNI